MVSQGNESRQRDLLIVPYSSWLDFLKRKFPCLYRPLRLPIVISENTANPLSDRIKLKIYHSQYIKSIDSPKRYFIKYSEKSNLII